MVIEEENGCLKLSTEKSHQSDNNEFKQISIENPSAKYRNQVCFPRTRRRAGRVRPPTPILHTITTPKHFKIVEEEYESEEAEILAWKERVKNVDLNDELYQFNQEKHWKMRCKFMEVGLLMERLGTIYEHPEEGNYNVSFEKAHDVPKQTGAVQKATIQSEEKAVADKMSVPSTVPTSRKNEIVEESFVEDNEINIEIPKSKKETGKSKLVDDENHEIVGGVPSQVLEKDGKISEILPAFTNGDNVKENCGIELSRLQRLGRRISLFVDQFRSKNTVNCKKFEHT